MRKMYALLVKKCLYVAAFVWGILLCVFALIYLAAFFCFLSGMEVAIDPRQWDPQDLLTMGVALIAMPFVLLLAYTPRMLRFRKMVLTQQAYPGQFNALVDEQTLTVKARPRPVPCRFIKICHAILHRGG